MNQQEIIQQAIDFITRERPDMVEKYNLNNNSQPYFLREIVVSDCYTTFDNATIITMLDNNEADKLKAAAKVNLEAEQLYKNLTKLILRENTDYLIDEILNEMRSKVNGQAAVN